MTRLLHVWAHIVRALLDLFRLFPRRAFNAWPSPVTWTSHIKLQRCKIYSKKKSDQKNETEKVAGSEHLTKSCFLESKIDLKTTRIRVSDVNSIFTPRIGKEQHVKHLVDRFESVELPESKNA